MGASTELGSYITTGRQVCALPADRYPARIVVECDTSGCSTRFTGDFVVSDDCGQAARLEYARAWLRDHGWSCTPTGDFCPLCAPCAQGGGVWC